MDNNLYIKNIKKELHYKNNINTIISNFKLNEHDNSLLLLCFQYLKKKYKFIDLTLEKKIKNFIP